MRTLNADKNRLCHWDNVKFLLILLVVVGHFIGIYKYDYMDLEKLFYVINIFHMPLFIFVGGLFSKSTVNGEKFKTERVIYFAILYFLLKVFILVVDIILEGSYQYRLLYDKGVQWYMLEMVLFLCATRFIRKLRPGFVLGMAVFVSCFTGYDPGVGQFLSLARFFEFYPFFLLGYYAEPDKISRLVQKSQAKIAGILILLGFAGICYFKVEWISWMGSLMVGYHSYELLPVPQLGCVARIIYYVTVLAVAFAVIAVVPQRKLFCSEWGKRTLSIYFWHRPVLTILLWAGLEEFLRKYLPGNWLWWYLGCAVILTLILVLPVFEKPLIWLKRQCRFVRNI